MKELFSLNTNGMFRIEQEGCIYSIREWDSGKDTFYDAAGQILQGYRPSELDEVDAPYEGDYTGDPEQVTPVVNGYYGYTTHEVSYDPGEMFGSFGIKAVDGRKITEEIYYQIDYFSCGLCAVRLKDSQWGCIDTQGRLVIPYQFSEPPRFNLYGVAVGDHSLIDVSGQPIANTMLNSLDSVCETDRYFVIALLTEAQLTSIDQCGTASDIVVDIYDTKERKYVVKGIPECKLDIYSNDVTHEVILQAVGMLNQYDSILLHGKGTIVGEKNKVITVFDFYQ